MMPMASHLFNRAVPAARPSIAPATPQETPLPPALAVALHHPIMFVTAVWLAAYVAIAFMA
jgi:hypothetical protein